MRTYTLNELFRFTRSELFDLHAEFVTMLNDLSEDSPELPVAYENLRCIRNALALTRLAPD